MKIFIGLADVASQASDLKKGFSSLGIESYAAILNRVISRQTRLTKSLREKNAFTNLPIRPNRLREILRYSMRRQTLLKEMSKTCDVFIFIWNTFHTDSRDFEYLKKLGKKIVVFFMGSEQRWKNAYEQDMNLFDIPSYYSNLKKNDHRNQSSKT